MPPLRNAITIMSDSFSTIFQYLYIVLVFIIVLAFVGFCVTLVIWDIKSVDNEKEYLNTLSKEERLIIARYNDNKHIKYTDMFRRKKNEDK